MAFIASDARQIQELFGLPISDLKSDSRLWEKLHDLEDFDSENGTTIVADIQTRLSELLDLDTDINDAAILTSGIKREKQDGEYEIEYHPSDTNNSNITPLLYKKMDLVAKIANDIGLQQNKVIA